MANELKNQIIVLELVLRGMGAAQPSDGPEKNPSWFDAIGFVWRERNKLMAELKALGGSMA